MYLRYKALFIYERFLYYFSFIVVSFTASAVVVALTVVFVVELGSPNIRHVPHWYLGLHLRLQQFAFFTHDLPSFWQ